LRQQQYEYYRELLFSFPKAEVANHDWTYQNDCWIEQLYCPQ
jgi:hypothetical protein